MAACGITQEQIATVMKCDAKTLRARARDQLDHGAIKANAMVANSLYQQAISGNVTAQIFWCKTRLKWAERHEFTGPEGQDITLNVKFV